MDSITFALHVQLIRCYNCNEMWITIITIKIVEEEKARKMKPIVWVIIFGLNEHNISSGYMKSNQYQELVYVNNMTKING